MPPRLLRLFRAEWDKLAANRLIAVLFVWIFPLGTLVLSSLAIVIALLSEDYRQQLLLQGISPWDGALLYTWGIVNSEVGRSVVVVFAAIVFTGEYQFGTWKQITTRQPRGLLIGVKWLTLIAYVLTAFITMSLIHAVASGILASIVGLDFGTVTAARLNDFLLEYMQRLGLGLALVLIATGYAAIAALISRTIVIAVGTGVILIIAEQVSIVFFALLEELLGINLIWLYRLTPGFNLANLGTWAISDRPLLPFQGGDLAAGFSPVGWAASATIVVIWVALLTGITSAHFRRQDLTT
ncbi:MAG: hypothetical protein ACOCXZ_02405 [Chloroflexota bacterium]